MRLIFVRHGESVANLLREFSNTGDKHPLTENGRSQVIELADRFSGLKIDRIYCSPLLRARQSAEILSQRLDAGCDVSPALAEYDVGDYEGRSDEAAWDHYLSVSADWMERGLWNSRLPNGESFDDIAGRFQPFINRLRCSESEATYLLVGHGGLFRCMLPLVLQNVDYSWSRQSDIGHVSWVEAKRHGPSLVCTRWDEREVLPTEFLVGPNFRPTADSS